MKTETVLYADVLFLIDFSMDFISLYITGKLIHAQLSPLRFSVAAAVAAAVEVVSTAAAIPSPAGAALGVICSVVMAFIAFGRGSVAPFFRRVALLWSSGALLGGIVTAVVSVGDGITIAGGGAHTNPSYYGVMFLGVALALFAVELIGRVSKKRSAQVSVEIFGNKVEFLALADSGNLLIDPFSGAPVIIVSESVLATALTSEEREALVSCSPCRAGERLASRVRLIPAKGIGGDKMLCAFRPDSASVDGRKTSAMIVADETKRGGFGEYDGVAPSALL